MLLVEGDGQVATDALAGPGLGGLQPVARLFAIAFAREVLGELCCNRPSLFTLCADRLELIEQQ